MSSNQNFLERKQLNILKALIKDMDMTATTDKPVISMDHDGIVTVTHNGEVLAKVHKDALETEDFKIEDGDNEGLYEFVKRFTSIDAAAEAIKAVSLAAN